MTETFVQMFRLPHYSLRLGNAERMFWRGVGFMTLLICCFYAVYLVEKQGLGLRSKERFVIDCIEAPMRFFAIAHIAIATLFMTTSKKNQTIGRRMGIFGLGVLGALLCFGWYTLAGNSQIWDMKHGTNLQVQAHLLILTYFLVHEVRDEAFFYRILGDAPKTASPESLDRLQSALVLYLPMTLVSFYLWPHQLLSAENRLPIIESLSPATRWVLSGIPAIAVVAFFRKFLIRESKAESLTVAQYCMLHAPLFRVMVGIVGVILVGALAFQRSTLLVLLHVSVWYVFSLDGLKARRPATPPQGWWPWMRSTPEGFRFLHLGLFALAGILSFLCVHVTGAEGVLWTVIAPASFAYWTIMHITLSFLPR